MRELMQNSRLFLSRFECFLLEGSNTLARHSSFRNLYQRDYRDSVL